jgi:hypothetical protein
MKVLLSAVLLCRVSLASDCDADATSLMQVRTNLELGSERNHPIEGSDHEDAINLELTKAKSASTVIDAQELEHNAVSNERTAKAAYRSAVWEARSAAAKLKTTQQQADSATAATEAHERKKFQMDLQAKRANASAELAASAFERANVSAAAAKAQADAAEDLSNDKAKAYRAAQDAQFDAEKNYKGVKAQARINKTMLDYQVKSTAAAVSANASADAQELAYNLSIISQNATQNFSDASANLTIANALKHDAMRQSFSAAGTARRAATQAQKWDRKTAAVNVDPSAVSATAADSIEEVTESSSSTVSLG